MLTKGNFTRDEWNHFLCLFNINHFSSTNRFSKMSKGTQEESGEEKVTAESRPMINLIARAPSNLSLSASESPVKKCVQSQSPWSTQAEKYDKTGQLVGQCTTTGNLLKARTQHVIQGGAMTKLRFPKSGKLINRWMIERTTRCRLLDKNTWVPIMFFFFHEHKHVIIEEEEVHDITETPVVCPQRGARPTQFIIGNDETVLDLSLGCMIKCEKDKKSMNVTEYTKKHCVLWEMLCV